MTREQQIVGKVAAYTLDVTDIETMRAVAELQSIRQGLDPETLKAMEFAEVVAVLDRIVASIDGLLGDGAAADILGPRVKVAELAVAIRAVFDLYKEQSAPQEKALSDLTETVPED